MLNLTHTYKSLPRVHASLMPVNCGPGCKQKLSAYQAKQPLGSQISEFFSKLFNTDDFPARWHCGKWSDFHGWLYILSDLGIWVAYFAIPIILLRIVMKRKDMPINGTILFFIAFVSLCGFSHLIDAIIFWWPAYRLSAVLRLATALVSLTGVFAVNRMVPILLRLRSVNVLKREIEKRKRTEERLSASEFLLSEAGRIARVGGWEFDLLSSNRMFSNTVYEILEIPKDYDIQKEHPLAYYPQPYRGLLDLAVEEALQKGVKWDLEVEATTLKGKRLWVRHIGEPVFNAQGVMIKLRGTVTDIDRYKKHELELSRSLEVTMEQKQQLKNFAHVLSHNIRNHTSNLSALSSLIEVEGIDDDNKDLILKSRKVTQALTTTLDDLASVIQAQEQITNQEWLFFEEVAAQTIEAHSFKIQQVQAQVTRYFEVPQIHFSRLYMDNIFGHLLSNAIRYRDPDRNLQVEFSTYMDKDGHVVFECRDNGLGIDLDLYGNKIFGLYATFHPTLSLRGVGLYLIKTQIESQGGEISVISHPGAGCVFRVVFCNKLQ